jgi:hypothetical protein
MGEASMSSQQRAAAPISPGSPTRPSLIATTKSTVDAVVAAGTVLYVLGFLSWACYAWTHDFGISPSPQAQYFVAGLVPGLLLAMFIGGLRVIGWLRERLRRAPTDAEVRAATRVAGVGMALFFGGGALGLILKRTAVGHSSFVEVLQYSGMIVMFGSFFFSPGALERRFARGAAWFLRSMRRSWSWLDSSSMWTAYFQTCQRNLAVPKRYASSWIWKRRACPRRPCARTSAGRPRQQRVRSGHSRSGLSQPLATSCSCWTGIRTRLRAQTGSSGRTISGFASRASLRPFQAMPAQASSLGRASLATLRILVRVSSQIRECNLCADSSGSIA